MRNAQGNCRWVTVIVAATSMMLAAASAASAQTFKTLSNLSGTTGTLPYSVPVQGSDGNLYGTAAGGGTHNSGTAFKLTPTGALTVLYNFCAQPSCTDGAGPGAGLILASDGNFYGSTGAGGNNPCPAEGGSGCGTIFRITPSGTLTTIHSFNGTDGADPFAALVQASDGGLYGTTVNGGNSSACIGGCGTVFRIGLGGKFETLHSFNLTDGSYPAGTLIQGTDGSFYGTAEGGGANSNNGTVFRMTSQDVFSTLYSFCSQPNCTDGSNPYGAGLVQGRDGIFYGTTAFGGTNGGGTIFSITPAGVLTTLHSFTGSDGTLPSRIIQATDGNLYGTTARGGAYGLCDGKSGCGTVFSFTPAGTLTTLFSFDGLDGDLAYNGVMQSTNGAFYGTTFIGGANSEGTIFALGVGLHPFARAVPTSGKIETAVTILATDLAGATSVTFNGTPATFTVESPTAIKTTVPTGATTGPVQVVTPSGTLTSNVNFQVLP